MNQISRRELLGGLAGVLAATGCRATLPTNISNRAGEGRVSTGEDRVDLQRASLLDDTYFLVPLNSKGMVLTGEEPSFGIIDEEESSTVFTQVGVRGGRANVSAPEGIYLPYAVNTSGGGNISLVYPGGENPIRLATNHQIPDIEEIRGKGKIRLGHLTMKDFPFKDETLKHDGTSYLISRIGKKTYERNSSLRNNTLPFFATRLPVDVEFDRTREEEVIRIIGDTYAFRRGESLTDYMEGRGFEPLETEPTQEGPTPEQIERREKAQRRKEQTVNIDTSQ